MFKIDDQSGFEYTTIPEFETIGSIMEDKSLLVNPVKLHSRLHSMQYTAMPDSDIDTVLNAMEDKELGKGYEFDYLLVAPFEREHGSKTTELQGFEKVFENDKYTMYKKK